MRRILLATAGALALGTAGWLAAERVEASLSAEVDLHDVRHVRSTTCRRCHEEHYESWHRTFHRTMTQDAAAEGAVLGDFSGAELEYGGVRARMSRDAEGAFLVTFAAAPDRAVPDDGRLLRREGERTLRVRRTVGSRRYQQLLAIDPGGEELLRLPVAWHVEESRWFHMNGAFLTADPAPAAAGRTIATADYERHVVRWNDNCVFCHNVAADPGLDPATGHFDTRVAELGIACEACHGPGDAHAGANHDPIRRYALHTSERPDPTIVNPDRLSPERSADVCGRCHGQRLADETTVRRFMQYGDPFVPGEALALYSSPLWRDTTLDDREGVFEPRFWGDGTARLTAYEYQGLLASPCAQRGELTCTTCHGMHEGDPRGQVRPDARGDGACIGCHESLADDDALTDHSGHSPTSSGARCTGCHMPRVVYGIIDVHLSHRIEIPDPGRDARAGRPDACTGCHVDRTRHWAVSAWAELWGGEGSVAIERTRLPEVRHRLLAGDPIERSVAAAALGRTNEAAAASRTRPDRLGALFDTMVADPYPAVRRIAWRSARALAAAPDAPWMRYRPTGARRAREAAVGALVQALPADAVRLPPPELATPLRAQARSVDIEIGE